jgi:mannose-6-phosphate isomerase-like protein (cupin superfamily)
MSFGGNGYCLGADDGEGYEFLNSLMIVKAGGADTRGQLAILEARTPPDYGPPPHVHADEEEVFYVLEGTVEVMCGDQQFVAGPGSLVLTPRGTLHTFHVTDEGPGKMLIITAPAQFERFVAEVGSPAQAMTLPSPEEPDVERLIKISAKYGITYPPPAVEERR